MPPERTYRLKIELDFTAAAPERGVLSEEARAASDAAVEAARAAIREAGATLLRTGHGARPLDRDQA